MKPRVYLAGKMEGLTWEHANWWREEMTNLLFPEFEVLSPMRGKARRTWKIHGPHPHQLFYGADVILTRDLNDIDRSDVIFAHFGIQEGVSVGTFLELGYAMGKKPVIMRIDEKDSFRQHPFIKRFPKGVVVKDLEDGAALLYSMFNL